MEQLRLLPIDPPRQIRPSAGVSDPAVWVAQVRILRELKEGDQFVVREVNLRRGLNIVWTPPHSRGNGNALFKSGVAGHTAGKTIFCRLIRHALGEATFANDSVRRRIREKLPSGWVLAQVWIGGDAWIVARPFGVGPHSFCVQGGTIEEALANGGKRIEYDRFIETVNHKACGNLPSKSFPATDEPLRWESVLPWLTRDQECRFGDFLDWRHRTSASDAPALDAEERQFMVRSILGLVSDAEREELQRNSRFLGQKKEAARRAPLFSHQATVDHSRVESILGMNLPPPSSGLFGSAARTEHERRLAELERSLAQLDSSDRRPELQSVMETVIASEATARRNLQEAEEQLQHHSGVLEQIVQKGQTDLLASLPPPQGYCRVPMDLAREAGCPLASSRPASLAEERGKRSAMEETDYHRRLVASLESQVQQMRDALSCAEDDSKTGRRNFLLANTSHEEARGKLYREQGRLSQIEHSVRQAELACDESTKHAEALKRIDEEIASSYAQQERLRRDRQEALGRLSRTFDYVLRAILGDEVQGRIDAAGRSLSLSADHHGERDSAAIETVKLLAFDLAALTESIEGRGHFPRFLIHDGPREADMAPDIYERLFLYARKLEDCFADEPSFQYIVTTTTPPNEDLLLDPWLRLTLAGMPSEQRLFRCDL